MMCTSENDILYVFVYIFYVYFSISLLSYINSNFRLDFNTLITECF